MPALDRDDWPLAPPRRNLWKDLCLGMAAGIVGTLVMERAHGRIAGLVSARRDGGGSDDGGADGETDAATEGPLDEVALVGPFHREGESAPETLARVGYRAVRGREPGDETREVLATELHWGTGIALGGLYGLLRGDRSSGLDLRAGLLFGAAAWLLNDEILVPALGLSEGPTAHGPEVHVPALGAHAVFGVATAATVQALERLL